MGKPLDVICVWFYYIVCFCTVHYTIIFIVLAIIISETSFLQLAIYSTTFNFCIAVEINEGNTTVKVFALLHACKTFDCHEKPQYTPHIFAHDYLLVYNCISILRRAHLCVILRENACMDIKSYTIIIY